VTGTWHLAQTAAASVALSLLMVTGVLAEDPVPGPDSKAQEGVPKGEVIKGVFEKSRIFPGTTRDYWVYVPKHLDPARAAPVMVFQDGLQYEAPVVFDNLIHKKEIPAMVGVFVMHGRVKALSDGALDRMNRSFEYDSITDDYARFLVEELLPYVAAEHKLNLSTDGNDRAIAGNSSGAICAFTAAWQRPDAFRRVFSAIGTYVGIHGGNNYPVMIRKTEPRPIRVFLQDGRNDLNNPHGSWWVANQDMLSALQFAGYDVRNEWGEGEHNGKHATAIFPDVLRWLWRGWPAPIEANPEGKSKQPFLEFLAPGEGFKLVSEGHEFTEGPATNAQGEVFFTDVAKSRIHKVGLDGKVSVFAEDTGGAAGLMFGADGRLYACASRRKQVAAYDPAGKATVLADAVECNGLAVTALGGVYFTDEPGKKVYFLPKGGTARVVDEGITNPNGVVLSADQSLLFVADTRGQRAYSFQVQPDGSLVHREPFFQLHVQDGTLRSDADGMTVDVEGRLYVATSLGIQVFDQMGRVIAILPKPFRAWLSNVAFGGPTLDELYVTCGGKVYKRKMRTKGALSWREPVKPPPPRL
jgi:sugar lactone lactonase YvrE